MKLGQHGTVQAHKFPIPHTRCYRWELRDIASGEIIKTESWHEFSDLWIKVLNRG